jgi:hypothetical protein
VSFESDIRPLLADRCGKCHSDSVQKSGLNLATLNGIRRGGESGEALLAESLHGSRLWEMIEQGEMPPEDETPLRAEEVDQIRRWIESGAALREQAAAPEEVTQHDVTPIVLLRCTTCHGPRLQQGGLDMRTKAGMLKGGQNGPAMVLGDPDASPMIRRLESEACPPRAMLLKYFVRRPSSSEVQTLRAWIAAGAPEVDTRPDVATTEPDPLVTDEDREHWAFQAPVVKPGPGSIDGYLQRKLVARGLAFSPQADRDTLIRRAHLDLIGLPPSVEDWRRYRADASAGWYEAMVEELLASPRYGERWGRYWLDLAGYADSEGGVSADPVRALAWKYRDYVIRAFNEDKPYDRFLLEQLAGDELVDVDHASEVTDEMVDNLVATGFLRMGIDETGSRTMNFVPERLKVISDAITVVGTGLMGLSLDCARCHSHKTDPIPQRDYYRLKAVFQGAMDEHDWDSFKTRKLSLGTPDQRARVKTINPPLAAELKKLESRHKQLVADTREALLRLHYPGRPEKDYTDIHSALKRADNQRSLRQKRLAERLRIAELRPDAEQPQAILDARREMKEIERDIDRLRRRMAPSLEIRALYDMGRPSPTYVLRRGEHDKPGALVGPGVPSVLTDGKTPFAVEPPFPGGTPKTGRRLALARWLTGPDHPLTARVMVNRIWHHHFGSGLVKELDSFGVQGEPPSHPELLDWLALEFIERGWSVKQMHRLIMNSRAYRQSSRVTAERIAIDPQNRLLSRMSIRRMDAEALRDSLLVVSGRLDTTPGGLPDTVSVSLEGQVSVNATDAGGWRRSVYLRYRRTEIPTMMDTFDYPKMGPNCVVRDVSTVSPQSLMLMNNGRVRELAASFATRVESMVGGGATRGAKVDAVYHLALSRSPSPDERATGIETLADLEGAWRGYPSRALETYCHVVFNSAAFLYVD